MKRLLSAVVATVSLVTIVPVGGALADPPERWEARPPVHIRGNAATSPVGYTPAQIRAAYGLAQVTADGQGQIIAIVDAYDAPTIQHDLAVFNSTFGIRPMASCPAGTGTGATPCFEKAYANGVKPRSNSGWALETSLDVEWAHAVAPGADILLVEAASSSFSDLLRAVDYAVARGAKVVSMSWGGSEFSSEATYDSHFRHAGVVFAASSGDSGSGVEWPAASPYVLSVGGTTLSLTGSGAVVSETAWSGSGGGISAYASEPGYQSSYPINSNGHRAVPDVAYIANPSSGVAVYDSTSYQGQKGWFMLGGTSVGAPQWAALVAVANQLRAQIGRAPLSTSDASFSAFYSVGVPPAYAQNYRDIVSGSDGSCAICAAVPGYDFVTGLGSPQADKLLPALQSY